MTMRMFGASVVAVVASFLAACGGPVPASCPDCFGGLDVTLFVTDSTTGAPVEGVTFTEGGEPLSVSCADTMPQMGVCKTGWNLDDPEPGEHTVIVSAPGHASKTVVYTLRDPGNCGCGEIVQPQIELDPL